MLPRTNRVTRAREFARAVRRGGRVPGRITVLHVVERDGGGPSRFGFIVAKAVGNAVQRNTVRRRLRAIGSTNIVELLPGRDIVIRALPGSAQASWATLQAEVTAGLAKGGVMR